MRNTSIQNRKKQAGYSLIEISIALIIVIGAAVAAYSLYQQSKASQEAQAAQQQIMGVVAAIKGIYSRPNFTGLTSAVLANSGRVPTDMISGTTLTNVFGGTVTVAPANVSGGTANGYTITYPQVGRAQCNSVVSGLRETFRKIVVDSTPVKDSIDASPVAYSETAVTTACNKEVNELIFTGV